MIILNTCTTVFLILNPKYALWTTPYHYYLYLHYRTIQLNGWRHTNKIYCFNQKKNNTHTQSFAFGSLFMTCNASENCALGRHRKSSSTRKLSKVFGALLGANAIQLSMFALTFYDLLLCARAGAPFHIDGGEEGDNVGTRRTGSHLKHGHCRCQSTVTISQQQLLSPVADWHSGRTLPAHKHIHTHTSNNHFHFDCLSSACDVNVDVAAPAKRPFRAFCTKDKSVQSKAGNQ